MRLTYSDGKFRLFDPSGQLAEGFASSKYWRKIPCGKGATYTTYKLKAARAFRQVADASAEKILNRAFLRFYPEPPRSSLPLFLDVHQKEGVKWVLTRSRSYLAHAPGAGKTCEAVVAALLSNPGFEDQAVVVVPPSLTENWAREIAKFSELAGYPASLEVAIVPRSAKKAEMNWDADWIIVPDSMLTRDWVLEELTKLSIRFLAVDEASRFKEATSQRTIALFGGKLKDGRESPGLVYRPKHSVLLDGSPMPNRTMELWAPVYAMAPETIDFMSQEEFGFQYCGGTINDFGRWEFKGNTRSDELRERLQKSFMHVVKEEELHHPERRRSILFMNEDVRTPEMKKWEKTHLARLSFSDISENMSQGEIASYRQELGLKKVAWVADYVSDRLTQKNESIIVFAWHREVISELARSLGKFNPGVVIGGTEETFREQLFRDFNLGLRKLILGNISAMGRGHNLQRGDRAVFAEYSWCDETNKQAEKRISRRGNEKAFMRSDYICAPGTMDEITLQALFRKAEAVKKVIG